MLLLNLTNDLGCFCVWFTHFTLTVCSIHIMRFKSEVGTVEKRGCVNRFSNLNNKTVFVISFHNDPQECFLIYNCLIKVRKGWLSVGDGKLKAVSHVEVRDLVHPSIHPKPFSLHEVLYCCTVTMTPNLFACQKQLSLSTQPQDVVCQAT